AKGQFVLRQPRGQARVVRTFGLVGLIPFVDLVQNYSLLLELERRREVLNRRSFRANDGPLINRGEEPGAITHGSAGTESPVAHDHVRRQVLAFAAETVNDPGANARVA